MTETGFAPHTHDRDWWSRRPRRSRSDSKVAGVAGGLARYLGVDPILFRVGFVALAVIGGAGILAYTLLWLLLPAEGDEVSAGEALLGRGRSSVSPIAAAVLAVVVVISVFATFNWGFPFWPAVVIGAIAFHIARKQRRGPFRPGSEWEGRLRAAAEDVAANRWTGAAGPAWGGPGTTGGHSGWGSWGGGCGGHSRTPADPPAAPTGQTAPTGNTDSPFDTPAFWDAPTAAAPRPPADPFAKNPPAGGDPFRKAPPSGAAVADPTGSTAWSGTPAGTAETRTSPPAWDPLGAAPFAWDLPDIELAPKADLVATRRRTASPVIARATIGVAVLTVAAQVLGILAGWWSPEWSALAGTALAVVAFGLLAQALRGRSLTLIPAGVLLSFATLALSVTGMSGTVSAGDRNWVANASTPLLSEYQLGAGDGFLDLSELVVPDGESVSTSVTVNAGQAVVQLPRDATVDVDCHTNAGRVDCLGIERDGLNTSVDTSEEGSRTAGTLHLEVHVGAGNVVVTR